MSAMNRRAALSSAARSGNVKRTKYFRGQMAAWVLIIPSLLLFYFVVWRPIVMGMGLSLFEMKGYTPVKFVGLENFKRILSDTQFVKTLGNTIQYVLLSLVVGYLPPLIMAIMLNEVRHLRGFMKFSIYFPVVIPAVVSSLLWYTIYYPDANGLLNMLMIRLGGNPIAWLQNERYTILMIIISMTWHSFGSTCIMYLASLQSINSELYEAALIDGAGVFRRIRSITLPKMSGVMLLFLVRQIIGVFQVMEQPLAMTGGGPSSASLSIALQTYRYAFVYFKVDSAMANGVITFLIILIMTFFYFWLEKRVEQ